jgi:membrane-associated phospholipid phosphatase
LDPLLHQWDVALHGGPSWLWFEAILRSRHLLQTLDLLYMFWFVGLIGFVLWAAWTRFRELRQRALVALLLLWIGGGTVMASFAASAGPVYYGEVVSTSSPYADLLNRLDSTATPSGPLKARRNQQGLWDLHTTDAWGPLAGISAMPSLHVGLAVLFALVAGQCSRWLAALLWAYAILIQVGSVVLGWHYAIDGYAGALIAAASWAAAASLCHGRTRAIATTVAEVPWQRDLPNKSPERTVCP